MGFIRSAVKGTDGFLAEEHELIYILERPVHFAENQIQATSIFGSTTRVTSGVSASLLVSLDLILCKVDRSF